MGLSIAETAHQEDYRRAQLGVAVVAGRPSGCEALADEIERLIWSRPDLDVTEITRWWLDEEG